MAWPLDLPARELLRLPGQAPPHEVTPWTLFDASWYARTYPDIAEVADTSDPDAVLRYHIEAGQRLGHAPNILFDEMWHRERYPGVAAAIEAGDYVSAFDAYCRRGNIDRSPHWLFDEPAYRELYPELTNDVLAEVGLANRYDHYLRHGSAEGRIGHPLFDPAVYLSNFDATDAEAVRAEGPFRHYLARIETGATELPTSIYFDPVWYLRRYPKVAMEISTGRWKCALHHYLCNDMPMDFDPIPDFSESHYLSRDPGLQRAIDARHFRSGYAHFLRFGARELRNPNESIDLRAYAAQPRVRADLQAGAASDAFTHWIRIGKRQGLMPGDALARHGQATDSDSFLHRSALAMLPRLGRGDFDFTCSATPELTVLIVTRNGFPDLMATIGSLRDTIRADVELIVVDHGATDETRALEDYVPGVKILRFDVGMEWVEAVNAGVQFASGTAVLFLAAGSRLAHGAIRPALDRLAADPGIGAIAGLVLRPQGMIAQAGGLLWRDGTCEKDLRGRSPLVPEANFVRSVSFGSPACLLARAELLASLDGFDAHIRTPDLATADLCLRLAAAGARVVYDPALAVFHDDADDRPCKPDETFLARHADLLAHRPVQAGTARAAARQAGDPPRRLLFIEDTVPLRSLGSGFVRANDLVRVMAALGWHVTVFPVNGSTHDVARVYLEMPDTAEVMHDRAADQLKELLLERPDFYDAVWIARAHNLDRVAADLRAWLADQAVRPMVVLDTEAVAPLRDAQQAALQGTPFDLDAAVHDWLRNADLADVLVTVNEPEATFLRQRGHGPVVVAGHMVDERASDGGFFQRSGLLFVGALHTAESPNYDSLVWFADEVLPRIEAVLGWETRLTVVGYVAAGVSLERFQRHPRITLRGAVGNLEPLYDSHRVFIAPTRFAAGSPYKVYEAASWGVPVVATDHLCAALGWTSGEEIMGAPPDPAAFAAAVIALYQHEALWSHVRQAALARLRQENGRTGFVESVEKILDSPRRHG